MVYLNSQLEWELKAIVGKCDDFLENWGVWRHRMTELV